MESNLNTALSPKDPNQQDTETGKLKENVLISDHFTVRY